jgi:hypothetical protein
MARRYRRCPPWYQGRGLGEPLEPCCRERSRNSLAEAADFEQ